MTIAQRFVEMGEQMGIDTSNCKTGNIAEVLNALTQDKGGEVSDSQNIQMAMMNLTNALNSSSNNTAENEPITEPDSPTEPTEPIEPTEPTNNTEGSGW